MVSSARAYVAALNKLLAWNNKQHLHHDHNNHQHHHQHHRAEPGFMPAPEELQQHDAAAASGARETEGEKTSDDNKGSKKLVAA